MSTLFPKVFTYLRSSGSRVDGVWVDSTTPAQFTGSIQPARGKDTAFLPTGRRDTGAIKIYSSTALQVSTDGGTSAGDIIVWGGYNWEVVTALPYTSGLIPHFKYLATLKEKAA